MYDNDMVNAVNQAIETIVQELENPYNRDLLMAVILFSDNENNKDSESFMSGFAVGHDAPSDFETFANHIHQVEAQLSDLLQGQTTVNMSALYDSYLKSRKEAKNNSGISTSQAHRFNAIVEKHNDGWSGAVYGMVCRTVQLKLRQKYAPRN